MLRKLCQITAGSESDAEHTSFEALPSRRKTLTMIGVLLAMLLSALDQTIVGTALPRIVRELGSPEHYTWVITSYLLASTVTVPIYGKLSDLFGRKWFFFWGIVVFLVGSVLCGLSQTLPQLIIFRAIQGIGGGAIMGNAFAIVADLFTPRERGKWQGIMGGVFGLATVIGPALGGFLTDNASWHWVFFVNLPLGLIALGFVAYLMPKVRSAIADKSIDYLGAVLLTTTIVPLLLGLTWGGNQYAWSSPQVIGLLGGAAASLVLFILAEARARQPIIALDLFKNSIFRVSALATFLTSVALFGAILYIPLFAQLIQGKSATDSGAILTPMMVGLITASIISGQIISRTGRYKAVALLGLVVLVIGLSSLTTIGTETGSLSLVVRMIVTGLGLGVTMPIFNIAVQNAFDRSRIGTVTAATQLFRNIGSTVGTAVLGSVFNNALTSRADELAATGFARQIRSLSTTSLAAAFDANPALQTVKLSFATLASPDKLQTVLSAEVAGALRAAFAAPGLATTGLAASFHDYVAVGDHVFVASVTGVFVAAAIIALLALIVTMFLREIPLRGRDSDARTSAGGSRVAGEEIAAGLGQAKGRAGDEPELVR